MSKRKDRKKAERAEGLDILRPAQQAEVEPTAMSDDELRTALAAGGNLKRQYALRSEMTQRAVNRRREAGETGPPTAREPLLDLASFKREVYRVSQMSSFESDTDAFAATLWPLVQRFAEAAWQDGRDDPGEGDNPYSLP